MNFAFLSPEFVSNHSSAGGLATFLGRLTQTLAERGHNVEVITPAKSGTELSRWRGVFVSHVSIPPFKPHLWDRFIGGAWGRINTDAISRTLHVAQALTEEFQRRNTYTPFDVVHGADFGLTTWFVPRRRGRVVVVRSSSPTAECRRWWGSVYRLDHVVLSWMERELFRRADMAYAPSQRTATYYRQLTGVPIEVIRPPFDSSSQPISSQPIESDSSYAIPPRYLLHFGNINRVKGSDWLARSLVKAWEEAPDLQMVWAGSDGSGLLPRFRQLWRERAAQVTWLGAVPREEIGAIVANAAAVAAPSRIDNLPNAVLEAQVIGVPVIGGRDSSIEEIVVDGVTGCLVNRDDVGGLARALVTAWRGQPPFHQRCFRPPIFEEMKPEIAVERLLALIEERRRQND